MAWRVNHDGRHGQGWLVDTIFETAHTRKQKKVPSSSSTEEAGDDPATKAVLQQQGNVVMLSPQQFSARVKTEAVRADHQASEYPARMMAAKFRGGMTPLRAMIRCGRGAAGP